MCRNNCAKINAILNNYFSTIWPQLAYFIYFNNVLEYTGEKVPAGALFAYNLKEQGKIFQHFLMEIFTITERPALLQEKKSNFLRAPNQ